MASGGMLKQQLTPQTLEKLLWNELCPNDTEDRNRIERMVDWITGMGKEGKK